MNCLSSLNQLMMIAPDLVVAGVFFSLGWVLFIGNRHTQLVSLSGFWYWLSLLCVLAGSIFIIDAWLFCHGLDEILSQTKVILALGCVLSAIVLYLKSREVFGRASIDYYKSLNQSYQNEIDNRIVLEAELINHKNLLQQEVWDATSDLRESKRILSTLISNLQGMAYRCKNDKDWSMQLVSSGCRELTGFTDKALMNNQPAYESLITQEYKIMVWDEVQKALNEHRPFQLSYQIKTKSGEIKDVTERGIGIYDNSERVIAIEGFIWDDTQLKQAKRKVQDLNTELRQLNEQLERKVAERTEELSSANLKLTQTLDELTQTQEHLIQAEKMSSLARLVSGIAHEINTPIGNVVTSISSICLICDQLAAQAEDAKTDFESLHNLATLARLAMESIQTAAGLVENFKQLSSDQFNQEKRLFNLSEYTQGIIFSFDNQTKNYDVDFEIDIPEKLQLYASPGSYSQMLSILIMNSLVHGFTKGTPASIKIEIENKQSHLIFNYFDNGQGIAEKDLPHIFDPFFKPNRASQGIGLGLHILYNLVVSSFQGKVSCTSNEGKGVHFRIELPLVLNPDE